MLSRLNALESRNELIGLALILIVVYLLFPERMPLEVAGLGMVNGSLLAIQAIGLVLVYRSNRILNFAQVQIGVVAATLFTSLAGFRPMLRPLAAVCPTCINRTVDNVNYVISLLISLAFAGAIGVLVYRFAIKRFSAAPRLVVTVATLFVAEALGFLVGKIPGWLSTAEQKEALADANATGLKAYFPFRWRLSVGAANFETADFLKVGIAVLAVVGIVIYLKKSAIGMAIRATAENPARAATLGISVDKTNSRVWVITSLLSTAAAIIIASERDANATLDAGLLVRLLTIMVIARLVSLPVALLAAVVMGIAEQGVLWSYQSTVPFEGSLFFVVGVILFFQRYRPSRVDVVVGTGWQASREVRPIPRVLRELGTVKAWLRAGAALGIVVLLGAPWVLAPNQNSLTVDVLIFGMVALSLLPLTGWAGQISLGQFALAAVGAYVVAWMHPPFLIAVPLGGLAGAVAATLLGLPALKLRGLHLAIITLAFALTTTRVLIDPSYLGKHLPARLNRPSLLGLNLNDQKVFYYVVLLVFGLLVLMVLGLRRSRTARALIAARDNDRAAQSFGVNVVRARLTAFAISGFLAGVGGALLAYHLNGVKVATFAPDLSLQVFRHAVLGGLGAIAGPIIGTVYYAITHIFTLPSVIAGLVTGVGGALVILLLPGGLGQLFFGLRDSWLRRVAAQNRIVVPSLVADVRTDGEEGKRLPIVPKVHPGGGTAFVPARFALDQQWAIDERASLDEQKTVPTRG